jgi:NADPH-dependent ferric siderophore reductase
MPTVPAALATRAERWFGRPAAVTTIDDLSTGLRQITIAGPALRGRQWIPGQEVEFRVGDRDLRHYTPASVDPHTGQMRIIFSLQANGPGTRWARELRPGTGVTVLGPGGGIGHHPSTRSVMLGDATTIGLFAALLAPADAAGATGDADGHAPGTAGSLGAVEVPAADRDAAAVLLPALYVVTAGAAPGAALVDWLTRNTDAVLPGSRAYLAGHAQTIQTLRAILRQRGTPRRSITTKPHWANGRTGL